MPPRTSSRRALVGGWACLVLAACTAQARPAAPPPVPAPTPPAAPDAPHPDVVVEPGAVSLPLSGYAITLPAPPPGITYHRSSSWALDAHGAFDSRDVIDEKSADGTIVVGNWITVGHFTAGDCGKVVEGTALDDAWPTETVERWGTRWELRGGVFTFTGALGRRPAIVMCAGGGDTKQLVLYRFFVDHAAGMTHDEMIAGLADAHVDEAVAQAYLANRTAAVAPTHQPAVWSRGAVAALRTVALPRANLRLTYPDDGFVWVEQPGGASGTSDMIDRMAPAQPALTIEIARMPGATCAQVYASITTPTGPALQPTGTGNGWSAGPALVVDDDTELITCHEGGGNAVLVGVFSTVTDLSPLQPMLDAIARAPAR